MAHEIELSGGPPPDPRVTGPYIRVMKDTIDNLSKERPGFDYGDIQIAYHNVGLAAKPTRTAPRKPSQDKVQDYFRRLVWHITGPAQHPNNPKSEAARLRRQFKYQNWDLTGRIDIRDDDRARDIPDHIWDDFPDPLLDWTDLSQYISKFYQDEKAILRARYQPAGDLWLTERELEENSTKKYIELRRYLDACRASGFSAVNATGDADLGVVNFPEDGNSLWYCLAHGPPMGSGSRETWATIKYQIWNYFNHVLAHPAHPRHRMYVVLQQQSSQEIEARAPGSEKLWGRMSIQRALYVNKSDSGPPMYCHFRGIYQVIADFFGKEVVVFTRPQTAEIEAYDLRKDPARVYDWKAYGSMNQGLDRGQILLVTDETLEQHQIAIYFEGHPEQYFDTSSSTSEDRYGWINAPWMNRPLRDDYEPIHLPSAPVDDDQFTAGVGSNLWYEFFGCGNAVSGNSSNHYNIGMETIFPDPQQAGWTEEWPAPPFRSPYPYPRGNHRVVTGIYTDGYGMDRWPQWYNIKAYEFYNFQAHAKSIGLDLEPVDKALSRGT
ncbi:hypothetical protein FHL15_005339 [Xylaria flabelliformis]|uniref:Uncharacterized protein n=1 Tax=Xylaria flabelliformis TaxID=2512241 RepID=A0A553I0D4_9PEZI|nr:hypothetical protein FHL15_005339 [Xylaria flabelliformis]